jgi:hypothetical protein
MISRVRKLQRGHGAAVGAVAHCHPSAVGMRDGAHDRQSKAGAPFAASTPGVRAPEPPGRLIQGGPAISHARAFVRPLWVEGL